MAADQLAATAGVAVLERGGGAADAAVATAAAMAVVGPHLCGLGGDMLAMVQAPGRPPEALLGVGRAGSGADPARLRTEGAIDMPLRGDARSVPVPGAVDGWLLLHGRYGRLPWAEVLAPAIALAEDGFPASVMLALASNLVARVRGAEELCPEGALRPGQIVRLPGVARTLRALASHGRDGFYGGEFGRALLETGAGEYSPSDLQRPLADWTAPLVVRAFGHDIWTVPPPSQGYLTLANAWIAERAGLPEDPADPGWPHVILEASRVAGADRPEVLHESADGAALVSPERLGPRADTIASAHHARGDMAVGGTPVDGTAVDDTAHDDTIGRPRGAGSLSPDGDTTHLCTVDADGVAVSLTQSNALDFGAHLVAGATGVFLHNRGVGFSLEAGHPAEYGPGRRPTHTLSPALVTDMQGRVTQVIGTMGGDAQPQILVQLLARLLHAGEDPATAISSARVVLEAVGAPPFRLWQAPTRSALMESHAPPDWQDGLAARGHRVRAVGAFNPVEVGCAQIISVDHREDRLVCAGATDPRNPEGDAIGR